MSKEPTQTIHIHANKTPNLNIDKHTLKKMVFLYNAINDGWSVRKNKESYIFRKKHEGKTEVFDESYLHTFITDNFDISNLLSTTTTTTL